MVNLVIFINLFFLPVLPLYVIYRRRQKPLRFDLDLLFQYCIVAACNIPLTKIFTFLSKRVGLFIAIDSGYYTLAALISSVLIYLLYVYQESGLREKHWAMLRGVCYELYSYVKKQYTYYTTYFRTKYWKEKVGQRGLKRVLGELAPAYLLIFASCFMMLIFEPILLYATNMNDFWFDFSIMIGPVLGVFSCFLLGGILVVSAVYFLNLIFSGRMILYRLLTLAGFIVFFLLYLQGNWLAGNLPPLTGESINWEDYGSSENFVLRVAVIVLCAAAVIFIWRFRLRCTVRYAAAGAGIICVLLTASLIPTVVENEALKSKDTFSPTLENFNTISTNRNFLVFLLDAVDSKSFYDVMMTDKDFDGILDDFTYYPDTLSTFSYTQNSIPNILTGAVQHNEIDFFDYSSNAYNQSPLFKKLVQNGYGINLYSSAVTWGGNREFEIENSTSIYDITVDFMSFMEQELRYIQFKYLPYGVKQYSEIETLDFNTCKVSDPEQNGYYSWGNVDNYGRIQETSVLDHSNKNYFQFIHCEGGHYPDNMDKYLNYIEGGTYEQKIAASLTMIKVYLQRLKDNDAYDNSVIIIMADHGRYQKVEEWYSGEDNEPYRSLDCMNPILFIKGINERHRLMESDRPISYCDLQNAFCDLIDGKQSAELFTEIQPGQKRTVLWGLWNQTHHMVEYETTGKAWEIKKFTPTGNVYDLKE